MSKVFVNIGLSLDGYMAPEGMTMNNPQYKNWGAKWGAMMSWIMKQQYFRENVLKFGPGGETGPINDMVRHTFERTGANIMGKRMFDQGERRVTMWWWNSMIGPRRSFVIAISHRTKRSKNYRTAACGSACI